MYLKLDTEEMFTKDRDMSDGKGVAVWQRLFFMKKKFVRFVRSKRNIIKLETV